jgi:hypothetical protein
MNEITDYKSPELKKLDEEYKRLLNAALKHLVVAESIKPDDQGTAIALKEVYVRLQNEEKAAEYTKRVKEMRK